MGHAVVEGRVAVAVGHVDDVPEDVRGDGLERRYVVPHHGRTGRLLTGHAEPLVLQGVQAEPLPKHRKVAISSSIYSPPRDPAESPRNEAFYRQSVRS